MDLYNGFSLQSQSTSSIKMQLPESVLALSENRLPLKEFIFTFVHSELLQNRNIQSIEQNINFRTTRANKLVEEIEMINNMDDEQLKAHKDVLEGAVEDAWKERRSELLSRKETLERYLEKALKLQAPTEDFKPFILHIQNKIRLAIFVVDEHILSDPKPEKEPDIHKWKEKRLHDLNWSLEEHDRIITSEVQSLQDIKDWMNELSTSLDKQLPSLPVVPNESEK